MGRPVKAWQRIFRATWCCTGGGGPYALAERLAHAAAVLAMIVEDVGSAEAARRPIRIVDKQAARVFAFGRASTWVDETIVLLGLGHEDSPLGQNGRTAGLACESVGQLALEIEVVVEVGVD